MISNRWAFNSLPSRCQCHCPPHSYSPFLCAHKCTSHLHLTNFRRTPHTLPFPFTFVYLLLCYNFPKFMCNVAHLVLFVPLRFSHRGRKSSRQHEDADGGLGESEKDFPCEYLGLEVAPRARALQYPAKGCVSYQLHHQSKGDL